MLYTMMMHLASDFKALCKKFIETQLIPEVVAGSNEML
jgi:hypothetical protein